MRYTARQRKIAARRKKPLIYSLKNLYDNAYAKGKPFFMANETDNRLFYSGRKWSDEVLGSGKAITTRYQFLRP